MKTLAWVIGSGGLLGRALSRSINGHPSWDRYTGQPLNWQNEPALLSSITANTLGLVRQAEQTGSRWCVLWVAGSAVNSTPHREVQREAETFSRSVDAILAASSSHDTGSIFFASSVGGAYGGAEFPPFTELTPTLAESPYGEFKLAAEKYVADQGQSAGLLVVCGRISNLYGPGQHMGKPQGFVSHLAMAGLAKKPMSIFVPLETVRDYIYVDDCARLVLATVERASELRSSVNLTHTKIIGSGLGLSINQILGYARSIELHHLPVILGSPPNSAHQASDLSVRSIVWPDLDAFEKTTFPAGYRSTSSDILRALQQA